MAVKLTDVAQKAGVSVTTVSRVINNHGYLSDKTKHKVFTAMKELNYQPNSLARSLQGKKMDWLFLGKSIQLISFFCLEVIEQGN